MPYRVLTTTEDTHPLRDPSVAAMREAYAVEVCAGHKDLASRRALAQVMGMGDDAATEKALTKDAYIIAMARVLFPTAHESMGDGADVHVAEVTRGAADFFAALS